MIKVEIPEPKSGLIAGDTLMNETYKLCSVFARLLTNDTLTENGGGEKLS